MKKSIDFETYLESVIKINKLELQSKMMLDVLKRVSRLNKSAKEHISENLLSDIEQLIKETELN